jgi:hypothetical protein
MPGNLRKDSFLAPQARAQLLPASRGAQHARFSRVGVGDPGFGLLGRNAAERAQSYEEL